MNARYYDDYDYDAAYSRYSRHGLREPAPIIESPWTPLVRLGARTLGALTTSGALSLLVHRLAIVDHNRSESRAITVDAFAWSLLISVIIAHAGPEVLKRVDKWLDTRTPQTEQLEFKGPRRKLMPDLVVHNRRNPLRSKPTQDEKWAQARAKAGSTSKRRFAQNVQPVQAAHVRPTVDDVADFYETTTYMFAQHREALVRRAFEARWGDGTARYTAYVGPKNVDMHAWSDGGLWKQWRVIEQVDGRGKCRFTREIDEILAMNGEVRQYARRRGWAL